MFTLGFAYNKSGKYFSKYQWLKSEASTQISATDVIAGQLGNWLHCHSLFHVYSGEVMTILQM